jgi:hypothetical protein
VLLNANPQLLEYIIENFKESGLNFATVSLEGNPAGHLALALASFSKYKARCVECLRLILSF